MTDTVKYFAIMITQTGVELELEMYHQDSRTYRFKYDQDLTSPSMAAVAALSEVMGVDPVELEPIQATVDTDALDRLVRVRDTMEGDVHVTFSVEDYAVTVHSYGVVAVAPAGDKRTAVRNKLVHQQ